MPQQDIHELVDHLFRHESGKMVSVLTRILGVSNMDTAEDIVQDTLVLALNTWKQRGIPERPVAWLHQIAKNKAIDWLRRQNRLIKIAPAYSYILKSDFATSSAFHQVFLDEEISDGQLRMMFACCHSEIPVDSQIALILKTLGGLSVEEIAKAFMTQNDTIAKRIYRAKEKLKREGVELEVPQGQILHDRLGAVLKSIYLLFSEGYNSSHPDLLIREDLCHEAMRLCMLLIDHPVTNLPRTRMLMALMCFQTSRLQARLDDKGHIILMKYQDRSKWYRPLIEKGFYFLNSAAEPFEVTTYHIEAMIASIHCASDSFEITNWKIVHELYDKLYALQPNPIVAMNRAIASAYSEGYAAGLQELLTIQGLDKHPVYWASLGEMYTEIGNAEEARKSFEKAASLTNSKVVKGLFLARIGFKG